MTEDSMRDDARPLRNPRSRLRRTALFVGVGVAAGAAGAWLGIGRSKPSPPEARGVEQLFGLSMDDAQGRSQALQQWRGKPLIVNFWATWCPPCVDEMPELQALHVEYAARGVQFIGLAVDGKSAVQEFAQRLKITYPLLLAGASGAELARSLGNAAGGLPFTLAVAPNGRTIGQHLGRIKAADIRAWIDTMATI